MAHRDTGLVERDKDLARQLEPFLELRRSVHFVRHVGAPDEHRLRVRLDELVEPEIGLGSARRLRGSSGQAQRSRRKSEGRAQKITTSKHGRIPHFAHL